MQFMNSKNKPGRSQVYSDRSIPIACVRGRQAVVVHFSKLLADAKMSEQQWRVMRIVQDFGPTPLSTLCERSCIHKVSMTRIIRTLSARGFVISRRNPQDGRALNISMTDEGHRFLGEVGHEADQISARIATEFGDEKTRLLLDLLDELSRLEI